MVDETEHAPVEGGPTDEPTAPTSESGADSTPQEPSLIDGIEPIERIGRGLVPAPPGPQEPVPAQVESPAVEPPSPDPIDSGSDSLTGQLAILLPDTEPPAGADDASVDEAIGAGSETGAADVGMPEDLAAVAQGLEEDEGAQGKGGSEEVLPDDDTGAIASIAPGTVTAADSDVAESDSTLVSAEASEAELAVSSGSVANWPFVVYVALWFVAAGVGVWEFLQVPTGQAIFDSSMYETSVMAGLGLLALGPILLLVVWAATAFTREDARRGALFISALIKGASATLLGAVIWMGALVLIDYLRLGRLL